MQDILIVEHLTNGGEYFIFRPLGNNSYHEIRLKINQQKKTMQASHTLLKEEVDFIEENLFQGDMKEDKTILNFRWYDQEFIKKTYSKIQ